MNISRIFIIRPIMTTLVMSGILIFGIMSYNTLPVSDLPNVDFPTIEVSASLPGTHPETMSSSVATPLEKVFSTIAGIESMTSISGLGSSRVTLQFSLERDIDAAAQDVQSAISSALRQLPSDMPSPPTLRKVNPADSPVLYITISSASLRMSDVNEYAENLMAQRISMVTGVAQVMVFGSQKYAVRIQVNPELLASREITLDEVANSIRKANVNLPTGTLSGSGKEYTVQASGQLVNATSYRPVIVAYRGGSPVRLEEIGRVIDSVEQNKRANWFNNEPSIILAIQRQPGTNTVEVVDAVKKLLPMFEKQIPSSIKMGIMYDYSESIKASVEDVKFTLLLTICLVVLVIFLFLRNISATFIPSLALPMSVVGTFSVMYLMDFSLDNISLMALTLSVGFVVDDAIVMLENIVRHMENGENPLDAALSGSSEISFTILSMTLSLAAVFIPVFFMGGIVGRLFHEFAVTIIASILISGFVSLSLTPMLCKLILRSSHTTHGKLYQTFENFFDMLRYVYDITLQKTIKYKFLIMVLSILVLMGTVHLFRITPKGFLPSGDTGQIQAVTEAEQGIAFDTMMKYQQKLADIIAKDPNVESFMSVIGSGGPNSGGNTGRFMIRLKPRAERQLSADELIQQLRPKLSSVPGIRVVLQNPPAIRIGGRFSKGLYQFTLQHPDTKALFHYSTLFESKMKELGIVQDVTSDLQLKNPQLNLDIDRDKSAALGISIYQIEDILATAYSSKEITTIYTSTNTYKVIMEIDPEYQKTPYDLSMLYIRSASGKLVPLETLVKYSLGVGPLTVNHSGQLPSVTISFNLVPGVSLGNAVQSVEQFARETLPAAFTTGFQGTAQAFQDSFKGLWMLLILSILVIYIVLGILYESFIHPLTILSGLPSAGAGALITLMLFQVDLNIYGFIGIIMLVGIVKKNAIMMIDFAIDAQRKSTAHLKIDAAQAIYQGALIRFRPIMMTTMAALMGTLPIAIGFGAGGEARRPLGLAVVGGLLVSQLLTLYFTPVYYIYLDSLQVTLGKILSKLTFRKNISDVSVG
ncbi:MAG: efflux RND transporter permease subunit [Desulfobacterales bacterium]|nr:efflux RND transporter permease subunit [Desulfobacterales bacterium]